LRALARFGLEFEPEVTAAMLAELGEGADRFVEVRDPYLIADHYGTLARALGTEPAVADRVQAELLAQAGR
jgi:hypothetical protein